MFWHVILVLFPPVYLMLALLFRDDRARLVVALYQLALVLSGLLLARKRLGDALMIVKPETLVAWLRLFSHYGRFIWASDYLTGC